MTPDEHDARIALRALTERYARGADRRRPADVAALFTPDGALFMFDADGRTPRSELRGAASIQRALGALDAYGATTHILGQQLVDELNMETGRAAAETYCMAHHVTVGPPRTDHVMAIRYLDRFEQVAGEWRFSERRLVIDWETDVVLGT